jgi:hypothetical protein
MCIDEAQPSQVVLVVRDATDEAAAFLFVHPQGRIIGKQHGKQRVGVGQHHADPRCGGLGFVGQVLSKVIVEPITVKRHTGNRHDDGRQGGHRGQGKQAAAQRGGKESVLRHLNDR